jgi:hypothetical protein
VCPPRQDGAGCVFLDGRGHVVDELLPRRLRVRAVDDGGLSHAPELPDRTHGRDGRHRDGVGAHGLEAGDDRVGCRLVSRSRECGQDVAGLEQLELDVLRANVVHQEVVRRDLVLGLRADEEALDAGERRCGLARGAGNRVDGDVDARVDCGADVPGARQPEGRRAVEELLLGDLAVDIRVQVAGAVLALGTEPVGEGEAALAAELQVGRVVAARVVGAEDGGAECGLEGVQVVRVALCALLDDELALGDHVVEARRSRRHQVCVAEHGDVLDRVRQHVDGALVGRGLEGHREVVGCRVAEFERSDHAVGGQLAQPVVRAHDDVGALAGGNLLDEVILHVVDRLADEVDLDAGLLLVGVRCALQRVHALRVDPDGQLAGGVVALRVVAAAPGRATRERQGRNHGDRAEGGDAPLVHLHWCEPLSVLMACRTASAYSMHRDRSDAQ